MQRFDAFKNWIQARVAKAERGASLVEYALLVALIAVVCIIAITTLGGEANSKFDDIGDCLNNPSGAECEAPEASIP